MRIAAAALSIVLGSWAAQAFAVCEANTRVTGNAFDTLLQAGTLICGRPAAGYAGQAADRWQEEHRAGGQLWDYKLGAGHPIDPSKQVGTWSLAANAVTHAYTGGPSFVWTVHSLDGSTYSFCTGQGGTEVVRAFVTTGTGPCAGYP